MRFVWSLSLIENLQSNNLDLSFCLLNRYIFYEFNSPVCEAGSYGYQREREREGRLVQMVYYAGSWWGWVVLMKDDDPEAGWRGNSQVLREKYAFFLGSSWKIFIFPGLLHITIGEAAGRSAHKTGEKQLNQMRCPLKSERTWNLLVHYLFTYLFPVQISTIFVEKNEGGALRFSMLAIKAYSPSFLSMRLRSC